MPKLHFLLSSLAQYIIVFDFLFIPQQISEWVPLLFNGVKEKTFYFCVL